MPNQKPREQDSFRQSGWETGTASTRSRRRKDFAFAVLGVLLLFMSLGVLTALLGSLFVDGMERLTGGHNVKVDGFAPMMAEEQGILEAYKGKADAEVAIRRPAVELKDPVQKIPEKMYTDNEGKFVEVFGDFHQPAQPSMEISEIKATDKTEIEKFSRDFIHGTLRRDGDKWFVDPSPIPLNMSKVETDWKSLIGETVSLEKSFSKVPLNVKAIEKLVFQSYFQSMPSREPSRAGIKSAWVGSILVMLVTMLIAVPLGVLAGIYLEEYGKKNWMTALLEINIANLAGIPSIVWGLMALGLFVYEFKLGRSILTAGVTLGLLVLPIVIMSTREAIRAIPQHIREASYACGASRWQTVWYHIIPYSLSGILTGSIIGLSRAIGETAPLITIGALTYIAFLPKFSWNQPFEWMGSGFTVLPIQMFNWVSRPGNEFHANAAAAGVILLALTLGLNALAIVFRYQLRKRIKW